MNALRAVFMAVLAVPLPLAAAGGIPPLRLTQETLQNGLRVVIVRQTRAPVFSLSVTYKVGSQDELPGNTGFAHFFEHMMFQGSAHVGKGEHFILIEKNGGRMNGTTSEDRTNYFEELPKNQLDLALFLEADRMRALAVTKTNVENQRQVVKEERRQSIDNQPYGRTWLELENLSYDNFAYKHSVIGEMKDLDAASLEQFQSFYKTYYAPDNAVLVLVGDVGVRTAMKKIRKYFDSIPRGPKPPVVDLAEAAHAGERRELIKDPLAKLERLDLSYVIPAGNTPDNYALLLLAAALGGGRSSRLYQGLVKQKELATEISSEAEARRGPGLFVVDALLRPGARESDLEADIDREIRDVRTHGISAAEREKALRQVLVGEIRTRESSLSTARAIGEYAVYYDDPNLINTFYERCSKETLADIQLAAQKYLRASRSSVIVTVPKKEAERDGKG